MEIAALLLFAAVALVHVYASHPAGSIEPAVSWFDPFRMSSTALINGMLLGVFMYWGWDCAVTVNEESTNSRTGPGQAAVTATILLIVIYLVVSVASQAYAGVHGLANNASDIFAGGLARSVLGSPLDKLMTLAVLTSSAAATQTTIQAGARVALSMARKQAFPTAFAHTHRRHQTPDIGTLVVGGASALWYVVIVNVSTNVLSDSITGLGLVVCFYYGLTGFACAVYYRRELLRSARSFLTLGVLPVAGASMLAGIFVKALLFYRHPANTSSKPVVGVGTPVAIGVGLLLVGVLVMLFARLRYRSFFNLRAEGADFHVLPAETEPRSQTALTAAVGALDASTARERGDLTQQ
jgi:amino acid transporter